MRSTTAIMPPTGAPPSRKKEEISGEEEDDHQHAYHDNGAERNEKKRILEGGAVDEQETNISNKRAKLGDGDVGIQVNFWDAVVDFQAAFSAYKSQSVTAEVEDPFDKTKKKVKVPCVVTQRFLANRAGRVVVALFGDFLSKFATQAVTSSLGLDFARLMPLPPLFEITKIITDDIPGLVGLIAAETSTEVIMLFADCAISDDKRKYFAAMANMSEHAQCTSPYGDQIKKGISMQVNENPLVNLLPPGTQLISVIIGNVFKNFTKAVVKRILATVTAVEKLDNRVSIFLRDLSKFFSGEIGITGLLSTWRQKFNLSDIAYNHFKEVFEAADGIIKDLINQFEKAIPKMAGVVQSSIDQTKSLTKKFLRKENIDIEPSEFIVGEHGATKETFETFCKDEYVQKHGEKAVTILNSKEIQNREMSEAEGYVRAITQPDGFYAKLFEDMYFKEFLRVLTNKLFGPEDTLEWKQPSSNQKWVLKADTFEFNPISRRFVRNPIYLHPTVLQHHKS